MLRGSITSYVDVAQVTLYAFFIFFAGLILYLRREDKREGYPLEPDRPNNILVQGFPEIPKPKTFLLPHGGTYSAPSRKVDRRPVRAEPVAPWPGAPLEPLGDPMLDGVGPAAYAERADVPELMLDGKPLIVPMRAATDTFVAHEDVDPRGLDVVAADRRVAGKVCDLWVDLAEPQIRYLEVEVADTEAGRHVLLPIGFAHIDARQGKVFVQSLFSRHFAHVPGLQSPDQVTKREEDRITAYFASGKLYGSPSRLGPLL